MLDLERRGMPRCKSSSEFEGGLQEVHPLHEPCGTTPR